MGKSSPDNNHAARIPRRDSLPPHWRKQGVDGNREDNRGQAIPGSYPKDDIGDDFAKRPNEDARSRMAQAVDVEIVIAFEHPFDKESVVAIDDVAVAPSNKDVVWVRKDAWGRPHAEGGT